LFAMGRDGRLATRDTLLGYAADQARAPAWRERSRMSQSPLSLTKTDVADQNA
jgi:hypothetical protein